MGKLKTIDVAVIGRSCLDYIAIVNQFPLENQKMPLEFRLIEGGGQGGTASCCISKLGGNVAYVGKLGDDAEGRICIERLDAFGVSTDFIEIVKGGRTPVAYAFITASTGERTIVYEPNKLPKIQMDDTLSHLLDQAKVALIDPEVTYLGKTIKALKGNHIKLVYDCERWRKDINDVMDTADFFIPSAEFLSAKELNFGQMPFKEKIAGDNFHAAFCLAITKGFNLHRAVRLSVAVASLSCREYGGRKGLPHMTEALEVAGSLKRKCLK
jgi:sugar/nucleoside kinase (ribokinase family)